MHRISSDSTIMDEHKNLNQDNERKPETDTTREVHTDSARYGQATSLSREETLRKTALYYRSRNVVGFVLGIIEALLLFRLLFKLLAANPKNAFVDFIYAITNILAAPFFGIFGNVGYNGGGTRYLFEPGTMVAMLVYAFLAVGVLRLLKIGLEEHA